MSVCATNLVTHGMISCQFIRNQLSSCAKPDVVSVVEVRPKIRQAAAPGPTGDPEPSITNVHELRPVTGAQVGPLAQPDDPPKNVGAQELKPKIIEAKED
jgi:hypothetical protein